MQIGWFFTIYQRRSRERMKLQERRPIKMKRKVLISILPILLLVLSTLSFAQPPQATPPPPAAPRSASFPKPSEQTLPNGLRVIVIERHESPLVSAQLLIKNGGEVDPPELAGLADMTADLITKGTQ